MNRFIYTSDITQIKTKKDTEIGNQKIIIRLNNQSAVFCIYPKLGNKYYHFGAQNLKQEIELFILDKWGLHIEDYYIIIPNNSIESVNNFIVLEIQLRLRGGSVIKVISKFFEAIFKPIVKPLAAIANAFLMLVKGILYIIMLFMWFLKFCVWFFTEVLPSIPTDIFGMVRFIAAILIDAVVGTIAYYFKKIFNAAGSTVIGATLSGWDNNPETDDTTRTKSQKAQTASEKSQFEDSEQKTDENQSSCEGRKCYRTEAGTVPWTVILATVLFPPAGVFMELGLHGFIQILVCLLLTFMFYFPGLIYALILLYC